jgi:hypothetical protein
MRTHPPDDFKLADLSVEAIELAEKSQANFEEVMS